MSARERVKSILQSEPQPKAKKKIRPKSAGDAVCLLNYRGNFVVESDESLAYCLTYRGNFVVESHKSLAAYCLTYRGNFVGESDESLAYCLTYRGNFVGKVTNLWRLIV